MKVAGVITNEWELTQLGLNLDVDENEIKRIIASKQDSESSAGCTKRLIVNTFGYFLKTKTRILVFKLPCKLVVYYFYILPPTNGVA